MLSILPQLEKLDDKDVSREEVHSARALFPDLPPLPAPSAPIQPYAGSSTPPPQAYPRSSTPPPQTSPGHYQQQMSPGGQYSQRTSSGGPYPQQPSPGGHYQQQASPAYQQAYPVPMSPPQHAYHAQQAQQLSPGWGHSPPATPASSPYLLPPAPAQSYGYPASPPPQLQSPSRRSPGPDSRQPPPQPYSQSNGILHDGELPQGGAAPGLHYGPGPPAEGYSMQPAQSPGAP